MAAQPDLEVINNAIGQLTGEITKFSNIPAIANGNAILEAINGLEGRLVAQIHDLEDRLVAQIHGLEDRLVARMRASNIMPLVHAITGEDIQNFPPTIAAIQALNLLEANHILTALNQPSAGLIAAKRSRILIAVGVTTIMQTITL
ncbi:hypothetical protein BJV78DRAFT_1154293 [Lactifluus subvellereus]|nr:hypothetical protein BJV78DRAFT_1154293 [Lactifluus subvellereus]